MTLIVEKDGVVLNKGEWDLVKVEVVDTIGNPWPGGPLPAPDDWDYQFTTKEVITNPFPVGAHYIDTEVVFTAKGRMVLATDHLRLREDAYPSTEEQMLAMLKGGAAQEAMSARIHAIDEQYPI